MVRKKATVSEKFAKAAISYYGCFKSTDSATFRTRNKVDAAMGIVRRIISDYAKGKAYNADKYYQIWRSKIA